MTRFSALRLASLTTVAALLGAGATLLPEPAAVLPGGSGTAAAAATATARSAGDCRPSERGVPSCGALVGATHGANDEPVVLERAAGQRLGIRRTYYTASQVDGALEEARTDVRAGRVPWISFKLPTSWDRMAAGAGDAWARDLAQRLDQLPGPVWLAFHHEPEGDGRIQDWTRLQERLGPIVRRTADNVAFTVVLTGWNQLYGDPAYALGRIWPDTKVDVAGFDVYNEYGVVKDGRRIDDWPHIVRNYYRPLAAWAEREGVAWGLAEVGLTDEAAARRPHWIRMAARALRRSGGVAFTYFDTYLNAYGSWSLKAGPKLTDFVRALRASARWS